MMSRRTRISILTLVLLAIFLMLLWFWWALRPRETVPELTVVEEAPAQEVIPTRPTISEQELEEEREVRTASADVVSLSKTFVERYGSYSNEAAFANLRDVLPLMSQEFAAATQVVIDEGEVPEEYYGVSTRVITVDVEASGETTARVRATTQREESVGSTQNTLVKYQEIVVAYIKEGGVWKIDSATWQ